MRSPSHCAAAILFAISLSAMCAPAPDPFGVDLQGHPIRQLTGPGIRGVVLIFAATDCPISNRYVPEVARLNREFANQGVRFWWVFPNPGDTASVVKQHDHDFSISESALLDPQQNLVRMAHATVTPEAALFMVEGGELHEVYDGRIDDRYISLGQEKPLAQHHELEAAIADAIASKPVPKPGGPPVGCSIVFLQP
ncbi:MAG TPA: hypothetical protein VMU48_16940 [Terracidiphilus sp.]|nr:hypothetical protein [Terracidiphilus sp.]